MVNREPTTSIVNELEKQNRRANFWIIFLFFFLLAAFSVVAVSVYFTQIKKQTIESQKDLTTICDEKMQSIHDWIKERLADAEVIKADRWAAASILTLTENPDDAAAQNVIASWLTSIIDAYDYESYLLLDPYGSELLSSTDAIHERPDETEEIFLEAILEDRIILTELYADLAGTGYYQDLLIPINDPDETRSSPIALVVLQIDASHFLYPTLQTWPVPSESGETIIFRQDGDKVTFISPLKFRPDSALEFQLSVDDPDLPAARIIRGDDSIGDGIDYRGVEVLYGGKGIPDSEWFLLAKIDRAEVFSDIRRQGWYLSTILLLLLIADLSTAYAFTHRQGVFYTEKLLALQKDSQEMTERYHLLLDAGNDIILLLDEKGNIVDFNDRARDAYGYQDQELHGMSTMALRVPRFQKPVIGFLKEVKDTGSLRGEVEHVRKNGSTFPVEVSIRHFMMNSSDYFLSIIRDITERKTAHIELEKSEARYRGLVEHASDGIFTADENGHLVSVNDAGCQMLGYTREELLGKSVFQLITNESLDTEPTHFWEIATGSHPYVVTEREVICKDGSILPIELTAFQLPDQGVQGIVRDISERIRHRQELEAALQQYQSLFDQNPIPSHIHNLKTGQILAVNDAALKLYGYSKEEFLEMKIDQLETDKKCHDPSENFNVPELHQHYKKDGSVVDVEVTSQKMVFNGLPCIMVLEMDVTERKRIEKALKENLGDLQSIVDTSPLAIITTDTKGIVTLWNKAAEKIFGWRSDETIGRELAYFPVNGEDKLTFVLNKIFQSEQALTYETVRRHKDGRNLTVRIHALSIRDYKGDVKGILAIISDETERKLIEAANLAMQEERNSLLHRLQLQFKNMPVGFLLTDENLNVIDWNPAAEKIFGYNREEVMGKSEFGMIIPKDQELIVRSAVKQSIKRNSTVVSRNENISKDGRRIIVDWQNTPLRDESGNLIAMMNMALDVTEKVEAENKLRESEEKLRGFFESNLIGIIWASLDGQVYTANDAYLNLIGYTRHDLEAGLVNWASLTPAEYLAIDKESIETAKREGTCAPYEKQYIRKDGSLVWILLGFIIIGENKDQSIAFALNISARKETEKALSESEIKYSNLFKNMLNGVAYCKMLYGKDGREIDYINLRVNDTFEKQTGLKDVEGKRITDVIPGIREANPELFEIYGRVARTGKPESFETFVPALGVHFSIHVYSPEKGYFTVVFEDISARKLAELEIRSKQELLNLTGSIAKVGGWELNAITGKGSWTDEVARIHDLEPDNPLAARVAIDYYQGKDREKFEKAFSEALASGKPYDLELEVITPKGARKIVRTNGLPEMEGGKVVRIRGIYQDITEIKKAEAEIKALNEGLERRVKERTSELQEANQELEAFTYSVSHDLRAPLRAIDGFSQIVADEYPNDIPPDVLRYLNLIRKNTRNMGRLVDDLLAFSRLGKQAVNKGKVNPTKLVREVASEIKNLEPKRKIKFNIEKMPVCEADETLLRQVYANLLTNAAKFTRQKDPAVIEAGICNAKPRQPDGSPGDEIKCYYVRDNGVGFDMRYYDKLFGVFQRLHNHEDYEGTGVGLAIVQRVIEKHNGIIWAESAIGSGTTFYFTLGKEIS